MRNVVILEIGRLSGMGEILLDQYLPVDNIATGIAIANEAIKEYIRPHIKTTIEHPDPQNWIVIEHNEYSGDMVRIVRVKEVSVSTLETLKQIKNENSTRFDKPVDARQ